MYCENCGNKLKGIEKFCGVCGTSVKVEEVSIEEDKEPISVVDEENDGFIAQNEIQKVENNQRVIDRRDVYSITTPALLVEEINKADDTLVQIEPYEADVYECQKRLNTIKNIGTLMRVVIGVAGFCFAANAGNAGGAIFTVALVAFVLVPILYKKSKSDPINQKLDHDRYCINTILNDTQSCIPTKFIYADGINYMKELIASGRANNLSEAIDKLEAQEHRWDIEAKNAEIIKQQEKQTRELREIKWSTWMNLWK